MIMACLVGPTTHKSPIEAPLRVAHFQMLRSPPPSATENDEEEEIVSRWKFHLHKNMDYLESIKKKLILCLAQNEAYIDFNEE